LSASATSRRDDTGYIQGLLDRAAVIPAGEYWCPDGVVVRSGYLAKARAAGREPGRPPDGFALSVPPFAQLNFGWGTGSQAYVHPQRLDLPARRRLGSVGGTVASEQMHARFPVSSAKGLGAS
jgi:hypothetical protein